MTKPIILSILAATIFTTAAQGQMIEYDGVYYNTLSTDNDGVVNVNVVAPNDFIYEGDVQVNSYFTKDNQKYKVSNNIATAFSNSKIKNFICGFDNAEYTSGSFISLVNDSDLERIQFLYPREYTGEMIQPTNNINLGNNRGCVYLYMREGETENTLIVDKFNVFGPDGERLKPRLMVEGTGELIYPDENNVFHLDTEWHWKGEYCMVLKISVYYVVFLYGETSDRKLVEVRVQPSLGQTGLTTVYEGLEYTINGNHAEILEDNSNDIEGELIIPDSIPYEGQQLPVTTIGAYAFRGYSISSVTLPASITSIGAGAFANCPNLVKADLSATAPNLLSSTFTNCNELSEVILPQTDATYTMSGTFINCTNLTSCKIPRNVYLSTPFTGSGVIKYEISRPNETEVNFRISKFDVLDMDGNKLPFSVYKNYTDYTVYETHTVIADNNGDIYTLPEYAFYNVYEEGRRSLNGYVNIGTQGIDCEYLSRGSSYAGFNLNQNDISGVEEITSDADEQEVYYNLQGLQVQPDALTHGIYIRRKGKTASKIMIR